MAEVGNPTIVATLTVVAALLPMLFVSGLMGPYMAPIPANASAAMVFSFFVAVMVTPWLMLRVAGRDARRARPRGSAHGRRLAWPALSSRRRSRSCASRRSAWRFLGLVGVATLASLLLFATKCGDGEAAAVRQQV